MSINTCDCPKCSNKLLYVQSKFGENLVEYASRSVKLTYAVNCYWCDFKFGDYETVTELENKFIEKFGGMKCQKQ